MKPQFSNAELIEEATRTICPRNIGNADSSVGGVAAVVVSATGNLYRGVCLDSNSGLGFCAERSAIAAMITNREYKITKVVAVYLDTKDQRLYVLPPCGACRQFMVFLSEDGLEIDIVLDASRTQKLGQLLPEAESAVGLGILPPGSQTAIADDIVGADRPPTES